MSTSLCVYTGQDRINNNDDDNVLSCGHAGVSSARRPAVSVLKQWLMQGQVTLQIIRLHSFNESVTTCKEMQSAAKALNNASQMSAKACYYNSPTWRFATGLSGRGLGVSVRENGSALARLRTQDRQLSIQFNYLYWHHHMQLQHCQGIRGNRRLVTQGIELHQWVFIQLELRLENKYHDVIHDYLFTYPV